MTQKLQRFDASFLRDLRGPLALHALQDIAEPEALPAAPPEPSYSEAELDAARMTGRKTGFAEGFEAGQAQAKKEAEALLHEANTAILGLGEALAATQLDYRHLLSTEARALSSLVVAIAKKVAGEALQANGAEAIMAMVNRCLPVLFSKPRVMVDVHPDMVEKVIARIESTLQQAGFEGEMQFRANPTLGHHDITLDWGAGQASRHTATLWQEIEDLLERMPPALAFAERPAQVIATDEQPTHILGEHDGR